MESVRFVDKHIKHKRQVRGWGANGVHMKCIECGCSYRLDVAIITHSTGVTPMQITYIVEPDDPALAWMDDEIKGTI